MTAPRRGFLAFVGGLAFTGSAVRDAAVVKPTLILPPRLVAAPAAFPLLAARPSMLEAMLHVATNTSENTFRQWLEAGLELAGPAPHPRRIGV